MSWISENPKISVIRLISAGRQYWNNYDGELRKKHKKLPIVDEMKVPKVRIIKSMKT